MLQNRALTGTINPATSTTTKSSSGAGVTDLADNSLGWESRIGAHAAVCVSLSEGQPPAPWRIRVRGWGETEAGVLVDGRAVPGCVLDVAVAMSHGADLLRSGVEALIIEMPEASNFEELKLWADLISLAEDRLGLERGTVEVVTALVAA